jgi:hypothetical protein
MMPQNSSNALVPYEAPGSVVPLHRAMPGDTPFKLVRDDVELHDRAEVVKFLPDILGRALARIWIDPTFYAEFSTNPKACLERAGVHLPEAISIEFSKAIADRPKIVVYEQKPNSRFKVRVLYLQLVMMAGK